MLLLGTTSQLKVKDWNRVKEFTAADRYVEDSLDGYTDAVDEVMNKGQPHALPQVVPEHKIHIDQLLKETKPVQKEVVARPAPQNKVQQIKMETAKLTQQKQQLENEISQLKNFINSRSLVQIGEDPIRANVTGQVNNNAHANFAQSQFTANLTG